MTKLSYDGANSLRKIYNKLVRDKIPEIIRASGATPTTRILSEREYLEALVEKLGEEYEEFKVARNVEEMADILEVINALIIELDIDHKELETLRQQKASKRGAFNNKIFLESVKE